MTKNLMRSSLTSNLIILIAFCFFFFEFFYFNEFISITHAQNIKNIDMEKHL
jgi:hypothetical protein